MLTAVAIIPSAPVLVPELAGTAAAELADARAAVHAAAASLPQRWVAIGTGAEAGRFGPDAGGTFAGFGVDVPIALSPTASTAQQLPLCALITGWTRATAHSDAVAEVHCLPADMASEDAVELGRRLGAELGESAQPTGVLIVADGLNTLTASAPGGHDPGAPAAQQRLDDALATGNAGALTELPGAVVGRAAYAALAGLLPAPRETVELYRGAPYGVGYFVGVWRP